MVSHYDFDTFVPDDVEGLIKWERSGSAGVLGMGVADMDFKVAQPITDALVRRAERGIFSYTSKPDWYYGNIVDWYERRYGWHIEREWLLNAPGIWTALRMCLQSYARPGAYVITQSPRFFPIQHVIDDAGCHLITNPMVLHNGRYTIDFEDFEAKIAEYRPMIYVMVNLQNPTGRVFTRSELQRLYEICARYDVLVVSDEVHSTIVFDGYEHTPAASLNEQARKRTIMLNSASKGYNLMDLTYCFVLIPDDALRDRFARTMLGYDMNFATNTFGAIGTAAAFGRECDVWLDDVRAYLARNRHLIAGYLQSELPAISPILPDGSFLMWLDCRALGVDDAALHRLFMEGAKVDVRMGDGYGPAGTGFVRLNFATTRARLVTALEQIKDAVKAM
ncbi:MalY/PatB family protein [Bifidobacterium sp.]|uniref:MalY/PatB family protein n=1 Tax=Bifidobacterium sp. TaxID=41200 RepID=UPI0039E759A2